MPPCTSTLHGAAQYFFEPALTPGTPGAIFLPCCTAAMDLTSRNGMTAMVNGKFFETEVGKLFAGFPFASLDVEAVMASQRKNLEALTQANQLAVQGFQELAKRQVEIARSAMDEASALVRAWTETGTAEERLQKQAAYAKQALDKSVESTRELVELAGKTQSEAFEVLNKRFTESLEEWGTLAKKKTQRQ